MGFFKNDKTNDQANKDSMATHTGFAPGGRGRHFGRPDGWVVSRDNVNAKDLQAPPPDSDAGWSVTGRK